MVEYKKGSFAVSLAGHDKGRLYIIIEGTEETGSEDFVFLADGRHRGVGSPKKKKVKHLQVVNRLEGHLKDLLEAGRPIRDEDIKYAIRAYANHKDASRVKED